jgi:carbonic anhydrase
MICINNTEFYKNLKEIENNFTKSDLDKYPILLSMYRKTFDINTTSITFNNNIKLLLNYKSNTLGSYINGNNYESIEFKIHITPTDNYSYIAVNDDVYILKQFHFHLLYNNLLEIHFIHENYNRNTNLSKIAIIALQWNNFLKDLSKFKKMFNLESNGNLTEIDLSMLNNINNYEYKYYAFTGSLEVDPSLYIYCKWFIFSIKNIDNLISIE